MYEHATQPLLSRRAFLRRALGHALLAVALVAVVDAVGTLGYHVFGGLEWIDAFLNASMILSGMGPLDRPGSTAGKVFAAIYALFSGLVFIGVMAIVLTPWAHRLLHRVHLERR